jgi:hypothetical protein
VSASPWGLAQPDAFRASAVKMRIIRNREMAAVVAHEPAVFSIAGFHQLELLAVYAIRTPQVFRFDASIFSPGSTVFCHQACCPVP